MAVDANGAPLGAAPDQNSAAAPSFPRWLGIALLLLVAVLFSANHVAARFAFDHGVTVTTAVAVRALVTAAVMALLLVLAGKARLPARPQLLHAMVIGVLVALQSYCLYAAVARLPVAIALLVFNTFPLLLALLSWVTRTETLHPRTWVAMPIALLGLALALDVFHGTAGAAARMDAPQFAAGLGFAIGGSFAFATALLLTTRWLGGMDGRLRTGLLMATVAVLVIVWGGVRAELAWPADGAGWTGLALLTALYGCAITVVFTVLPKIGAANNAAVMNVEPVSALALGWMFLGQTILPVQMLGMALVIAAVVLLSARRR